MCVTCFVRSSALSIVEPLITLSKRLRGMPGTEDETGGGIDTKERERLLDKLKGLDILDDVDDLQTPDPAAFLPFDTHAQAVSLAYPTCGCVCARAGAGSVSREC